MYVWFDAFTSWVSSQESTKQQKHCIWQFSSWLYWQESPRDSGPDAWAQADGTVFPFRCSFTCKGQKTSRWGKHWGLHWEPSQWMDSPETVITNSTQNEKARIASCQFFSDIASFCYTASSTDRNGWKDRQAFWKFPFFCNCSNISCMCQLV